MITRLSNMIFGDSSVSYSIIFKEFSIVLSLGVSIN